MYNRRTHHARFRSDQATSPDYQRRLALIDPTRGGANEQRGGDFHVLLVAHVHTTLRRKTNRITDRSGKTTEAERPARKCGDEGGSVLALAKGLLRPAQEQHQHQQHHWNNNN